MQEHFLPSKESITRSVVPNPFYTLSIATGKEEDPKHLLDYRSSEIGRITMDDLVVYHVVHDQGAYTLD